MVNSAASVRNSTCLLYHSPCTTEKTLVQFGGIISEGKTKTPFPGTTLIDLGEIITFMQCVIMLYMTEIGPMRDLIASHARLLKSCEYIQCSFHLPYTIEHAIQ